MNEVIYLIGQISKEREITYRWRQEVRKFFSGGGENYGFELIDPCDNEWNMGMVKLNGEGERFAYYNSVGASLIVPKDYGYVMRSTGCIANMNHYDTKKPMIGTLFELAWYYKHQEKCVIGVFDGDWQEDSICNHPFVRETVDVWCKDHMEAAKLLKTFYRRGVDAVTSTMVGLDNDWEYITEEES